MNTRNRVHALIVHQWITDWNNVYFSDDQHRKKPEPSFYLFTLPASQLKRLSDVYRRKADRPRSEDLAIQRTHEKSRSEEIRRFIFGGFPWSQLSEKQKSESEYIDLRMPGWLPTAIVANILPPGTKRGKFTLKSEDAIKIESTSDSTAKILLPEQYSQNTWTPDVRPLEIIDGQHRLYAFEEFDEFNGDFELPVVAFYDLDRTWQAYLFYTINIKPKKINISLAYDLYPLLRVQEWLEKSQDGLLVYRETRAQELTEILWSYPDSPWYQRINMLGEKSGGDVTQAAFIRSLLTSFVKKGYPIGGLFGDELRKTGDVLQWSRVKQAAFLVFVWQAVQKAVENTQEEWAVSLRNTSKKNPKQLSLEIAPNKQLDPAFAGPTTLLATDQGVRGILQVTNDMCFVAADELALSDWIISDEIESNEIDNVVLDQILHIIREQPFARFLEKIAQELCQFDWRTSSAGELSESQRLAQMVFKGSSGYKELRRQLLEILSSSSDKLVNTTAETVKELLKY